MLKPRQPASREKPGEVDQISPQSSNQIENDVAVRKRAKAEMGRLRPIIVAYSILLFLICFYAPWQSRIIGLDGTVVADDKVMYYPIFPGPNFRVQKSRDQSSGLQFWFIDTKRIAIELGILSALASVTITLVRWRKTGG